MNLTSIKNIADAKLDGVTVAWTRIDQTVKEITFTDAAGHVVQIRGDYGITVSIPAPPKKADRWVVSGKFMDVADIKETFASEYEAKDKLEEFKTKAGYGVETGLTMAKVAVLVDPDGEIVPSDEIPF